MKMNVHELKSELLLAILNHKYGRKGYMYSTLHFEVKYEMLVFWVIIMSQQSKSHLCFCVYQVLLKYDSHL